MAESKASEDLTPQGLAKTRSDPDSEPKSAELWAAPAKASETAPWTRLLKSSLAAAGGPTTGLGLQAKLLALTALFVMLAEVLIFVPSVANFRVNWLLDRLTAGRLAALAVEANPEGAVPPMLRDELLETARVFAVAVRRPDQHRLILAGPQMPELAGSFDLRTNMKAGLLSNLASRVSLIGEALAVFSRGPDSAIRVIGTASAMAMPTVEPADYVEIMLFEAPLKAAMLRYGLNVMGLSIVISSIAAALIYWALSGLLVMPMRKVALNMMRFRQMPEDARAWIVPSARSDEIGFVERELHRMQSEIAQLLKQKTRLAALGLAVAKINHDLRNMLASAVVLSDRLGAVADPTVQRVAPKLIASIDRAAKFCNDTLRYGSAQEALPNRTLARLADVVADVGDGLHLPNEDVALAIDVAPDLTIDADPDQLYRILNNLVRNAWEALQSQANAATASKIITVAGRRDGSTTVVTVADNGPGVPAKARAKLFTAFEGSSRPGGTGLGLAIARELAVAHGGNLRLLDTHQGAAFELIIPDR